MLELDLTLDLEPLSGQALLEQLVSITEEAGLPFPPVPRELVPLLRELGDMRFGTRPDAPPLLDLAGWRDEWLAKPVPDYVMYGVEGHGAVSQLLHYYLVSGPVAVFLQHRLSGPFAEQLAGRMRMKFAALPALLTRAEAARQSGRLGPEEAVLVLDSDLHGQRWARVRHGTDPQWRAGDGFEEFLGQLA